MKAVLGEFGLGSLVFGAMLFDGSMLIGSALIVLGTLLALPSILEEVRGSFLRHGALS